MKRVVPAVLATGCIVLIAAGIYFLFSARQSGGTADFAGSASCRECHQGFHELWERSMHGRSVREFSREFASAHLPATAWATTVAGVRAEMRVTEGLLHVGTGSETQSLPLRFAVGGKNVIYLLASTDRGRLQTLPVAYDVRRRAWFNTAESNVRHVAGAVPDTALHWTHRAFTFNTLCSRCHVSQYSPHYVVEADSYATTWAEPGINCETCHGPGDGHVRLFRSQGGKSADPKIVSTKKFTAEQTNSLCGSCHARMSPLTATFPPGSRFFDHFDLATLDNPDFYPDGRDMGENYTFTSWLLSPCVKSGKLDCLHCHTSGGGFRFAGKPDAACLPCHAQHVGNPGEHSRHRAGTNGGRCIDCHMPVSEFARMKRSDHSLRAPAPAASVRFGSPNACNRCHAGKSPQWADRLVRRWHKRDYQAPLVLRGELIAAARKHDWSRLDEMIRFIGNEKSEDVLAASLIRLLKACDDDRKWPAVIQALSAPSPLVRAAAAEALDGKLTPVIMPLLLNAATDEYRLVRIRSAAALARLSSAAFNAEHIPAVEAATAELRASFLARPDDAASQFNLGNFHAGRGEYQQAVEAYEQAIRLQPEWEAVRINASLAYNALQRNHEAESHLRTVLSMQPGNAAAHLNLGLLLGELGRRDEAEASLRAAFAYDSTSAPAAFNLAVLLGDRVPGEAIEWAARAVRLRPDEAKYVDALSVYKKENTRRYPHSDAK